MFAIITLLLLISPLSALAQEIEETAYAICKERVLHTQDDDVEVSSGDITITGPRWTMHWTETESQIVNGDRISIPFDSSEVIITGQNANTALHVWDIRSVWNDGKQLFGIRSGEKIHLILAYPPNQTRGVVTCYVLPLHQ